METEKEKKSNNNHNAEKHRPGLETGYNHCTKEYNISVTFVSPRWKLYACISTQEISFNYHRWLN